MNIKVTVDYANGCYNVTGLHNKDVCIWQWPINDGRKKIKISDIRKGLKDQIHILNYKAKGEEHYSFKAVKDVDPLLYRALTSWDRSNKTNYAIEYLKAVTKDYKIERPAGLPLSMYKDKLKCARLEYLEKAGIDVSYNVALVNTDERLSFFDKLRGIFFARKQREVFGNGIKVNSSFALKNAYYLNDPNIVMDTLEHGDSREQEPPVSEIPTPIKETPTPKSPAKETPVPKSPAKETPAPKSPEKEVPAPKSPAKETPAPKSPEKEVPTPKSPAKETSAPKTPVKEAPVQQDKKTQDEPKNQKTKNLTGGTRKSARERAKKLNEIRRRKGNKSSKKKRTVKNHPTTRKHLTKKQREQAKKRKIRSETPQERNRRLTEAKRENQRKIKEAHERKEAEKAREIENDKELKKEAEKEARAQKLADEITRNLARAEEDDILEDLPLNEPITDGENNNNNNNNNNEQESQKQKSEKKKVLVLKIKNKLNETKFGRRVNAEIRHWTRKIHSAKESIKNFKFKPNPKFKKILITGAVSVLGVITIFAASNAIKNGGFINPNPSSSVPGYTTEDPYQSESPSPDQEPSSSPEVTPPGEQPSDSPEATSPGQEQDDASETTPLGQEQGGGSGTTTPEQGQETGKTDAEKLEEFRQMAFEEYKKAFIIGSKPAVGDMLTDQIYYENPDGTGNFGYFAGYTDYTISHINLISNKGWETVRLEGKSLQDLLSEHPECVGYNIHFINAKTGGGLGFITKDQLEGLIKEKVDSIIESKQQSDLNLEDFMR